MTQDMGYYAANTNKSRSKLTMLIKTSKLLRAMIEGQDQDFKKNLLSEIVYEVKLKNVKNKMVEIFQCKIGGD